MDFCTCCAYYFNVVPLPIILQESGRVTGIIERSNPRISITKLAEYSIAGSARRRKIVEEQQRRGAFFVSPYNEAISSLCDYLIDPERDVSALFAQIQHWQQDEGNSAWEAQRNRLCAEAVMHFLGLVSDLPRDVGFIRASARPPLLECNGLMISVRPELIGHGRMPRGTETVGAVKFYFSKTKPLTADTGALMALALANHSEKYLTLERPLKLRDCMVLDVFGGRIHRPRPSRHTRLLLQETCEEIRDLWQEVRDGNSEIPEHARLSPGVPHAINSLSF